MRSKTESIIYERFSRLKQYLTRLKTEWDDPISMKYHLDQWSYPKESTKAFADFVAPVLFNSKVVLDIGTGAGAATYSLAKRFPQVSFTGIDPSAILIQTAREFSQDIENIQFENGNWFNLKAREGVDGVISIQTLSFISSMEYPLVQIFRKIKPKWIALTSLFYEGDISCSIVVKEHSRKRNVHYNIVSIKALSRLAKKYGYKISEYVPFDIGIDIPQPKNLDLMGTYTRQILEDESLKRIQISGPLLMSWYFILLECEEMT